MALTKEDIRQSLASMQELITQQEGDEINVLIGDTIESILFPMRPKSVLGIATDAAREVIETSVRDMLFMCTGDAILPESFNDSILEHYSVTTPVIQDHIEELIRIGMIDQKAAIFAYNETAASFKSSLGPYAGVMMRHYPLMGNGVHPLIVAGIDIEIVPKRMVDSCKEQWEYLDKSEKDRFQNVEIYTKFVYSSAVDQLNRVIEVLKRGGTHAAIQFSHPASLPISDRGPREQAFFDRSSAFEFLRSISFWVDPESKKIRAQVFIRTCSSEMLYFHMLPMFSFLVNRIADEAQMEAEALEFVVERIYMEVDQKNIDLLTELVKETAVEYHPYPSWIPVKPLASIVVEDLITKEQNNG